MTSLVRHLAGRELERSSFPLAFQEYVNTVLNYNGVNYPMGGMQQTLTGNAEPIPHSLSGSFGWNSVVTACLLTRADHFCEARFQWRRLRNGRPGPLFGDGNLAPIETPWPNGTTGDLLARMIQDADLAGSAYILGQGKGVARLRPDWTQIILGSRTRRSDFRPGDADTEVAGYQYTPGGPSGGRDAVLFLPEEIAHFAPIPDPQGYFRGMSLVRAALQEIQADQSMSRHRQRFFDNGATVNQVVKLTPPKMEEFNEYVRKFRESHQGVDNAYKTLFVTGATDVQSIGSDMQQLEFRATQGAGETRIAAALRTHPVLVGLSEGMAGSSLNAGNYQAARRAFADGTMRPLWRKAAGALQTILRVPSSVTGSSAAQLWYDDRDIAFLQEDMKDTAEVQQMQSAAIKSLIDAGYKPDACVDAVTSNDYSQLVGQHSGLYSVQLQPPGTSSPPSGGTAEAA